MTQQSRFDDTAMRSRPRSRVIKAANPAQERPQRRQRETRRALSPDNSERVSRPLQSSREGARKPVARRRVEARPPASPRRKSAAPAKPAADSSSRWYQASWMQSRWLKYSLMATVTALMIAVAFMQPIDRSSESQLDSALTRALIGFGIARTLNGVISVAQGTEFAVQPAGVGVNFSPGEILDPINDLVERFSWVMLVATSSLGIQKILLEVSSWVGISFMLAGAAVFWMLTRMKKGAASSVAKFASRVLLVMLLVRFLIPLGAIANDWVYRQFLEPRFESSSQQLEVASERIREISTRQTNPQPEAESLRQKARNIYQSVTGKFDFDGMLQDYRRSAENVSEHAINLIVVFVLQTILFPVLFLYLVYRAFRYLLLPPAAT